MSLMPLFLSSKFLAFSILAFGCDLQSSREFRSVFCLLLVWTFFLDADGFSSIAFFESEVLRGGALDGGAFNVWEVCDNFFVLTTK